MPSEFAKRVAERVFQGLLSRGVSRYEVEEAVDAELAAAPSPAATELAHGIMPNYDPLGTGLPSSGDDAYNAGLEPAAKIAESGTCKGADPFTGIATAIRALKK